MIYILFGNDSKKKKEFLKKLCNGVLPFFDYKNELKREDLINQSKSVNLFNELQIIVLENFIDNKNLILSDDDLTSLEKSETIFVFLEDKLLSSDIKKYQKYAKLEKFEAPVIKQIPKMNVFNIAEAFSKRDKIGTWIIYRQAISLGVSPEEISGILFWKVKNMIMNNNRTFTNTELKNFSSELTNIYHNSHSGKIDFTIALEKFILSSLNKK